MWPENEDKDKNESQRLDITSVVGIFSTNIVTIFLGPFLCIIQCSINHNRILKHWKIFNIKVLFSVL